MIKKYDFVSILRCFSTRPTPVRALTPVGVAKRPATLKSSNATWWTTMDSSWCQVVQPYFSKWSVEPWKVALKALRWNVLFFFDAHAVLFCFSPFEWLPLWKVRLNRHALKSMDFVFVARPEDSGWLKCIRFIEKSFKSDFSFSASMYPLQRSLCVYTNVSKITFKTRISPITQSHYNPNKWMGSTAKKT